MEIVKSTRDYAGTRIDLIRDFLFRLHTAVEISDIDSFLKSMLCITVRACG